MGREGSHLPATHRQVAGKCEEIIWGLTRGSACGTTPGWMIFTPMG